MTRSIRRRQWHGVLVGGLLLLAVPTLASAQNTFPATGSVGIGTTSPNRSLHVVAGGFVGDGFTVQGNSSNPYPSFSFSSVGAPVVRYWSMSVRGGFAGQFNIDDGTAGATRLAIDTSGNVGIGTVVPVAKLHVAGDAQVDGNLAAKYQDVAEWVQAPSLPASGVVVVVDPQSPNQVLPASTPYDTRVAGVVSARPGLLLGEAGDSKVKVAHSGRVKVKVDAGYGPIVVGDLLVTSPTPGHAMRSKPLELGGISIHRPGTLLGKALEPLQAGQDEILVLLTLQ